MASKRREKQTPQQPVTPREQLPADTPKQTDSGANVFATVPEAAKFLRLSLPFVYKLIATRQLPSARFGRAVRIPWAALRSFADQALSAG
jgi:excisionase family DNA binding protein